MFMRVPEGRKKEASNAIQTTKQSNTNYVPKAVNFPKKNDLLRVQVYTCTFIAGIEKYQILMTMYACWFKTLPSVV